MSKRKMDRALSVANPIDAGQVEALELEHAEWELLSDIVAESQDRDVAASAVSGGSRWRDRTVTRLPMIVAAGACVVVALLLVNGGGGSAGAPASAYAAELARIAEDSEVVVFDPASAKRPQRPQSSGGWAEIATIWDCTELPCVKKSAAEMEGVGFAAPEVKTSRAGTVAIVIPPADGD
jgi:hypothetical protein